MSSITGEKIKQVSAVGHLHLLPSAPEQDQEGRADAIEDVT